LVAAIRISVIGRGDHHRVEILLRDQVGVAREGLRRGHAGLRLGDAGERAFEVDLPHVAERRDLDVQLLRAAEDFAEQVVAAAAATDQADAQAVIRAKHLLRQRRRHRHACRRGSGCPNEVAPIGWSRHGGTPWI
jgi:hypothetical protein